MGVAERVRRWRGELLPAGIAWLLLGFSALFATLNDRSRPHALGTLLIALLAAVWLAALAAPPNHTLLRIAEYAGLLVLIAVLVHRSPLFGFFAFSGYLYANALPRRLAVVGVIATAVLTGSSQAGGLPPPPSTDTATYVGLIAVNIVVAVALTAFSRTLEEQSEKRRQMVVEISEANAKLQDALTENAGLHAQLVAQAREAGILDERQRLAREIHDTLAQGLIGILTQLQAADEAAEDVRRRHLDNAGQLARHSLNEARRSVQALRPELLESAQLPQAVAEAVRQWSDVSGVPASATTTGTARPLPPDVEVTLLRTAQEALANVAKHAEAARAGVTLSYMEDMVTLDVRDDGAGFDGNCVPASGDPQGGFGLVAMRERLATIGGTLEIESAPGEGTAISASVPCGGVS